ncbi:MAG: hypothetical protein BRD29_01875 [Bacteroidetes bacterium QH_2_67_10]|nr:MAG: hypothetical protein BRD29_01875 [Bacteroidetes bacterium QH_2_67_10]
MRSRSFFWTAPRWRATRCSKSSGTRSSVRAPANRCSSASRTRARRTAGMRAARRTRTASRRSSKTSKNAIEFDSVENFRTQIRERLGEAAQQRADEALQREIVQRMRELHPAPVPPDVVEKFLDSFIEDVKRRNDDELPDDFDENVFREKNRSEAREQAHWMLLRDKVVDTYDLKATDEDLEAFFEKQAARTPELEADQLKRFYESQDEAMDQVRQQVLSEKVFDTLEEQFQINEKDREAFEQELKARQPAAASAEGAASAEADDASDDEPLIVT